MVTEVMGFLIVAGVAILCVVHFFSKRDSRSMAEQQEMQESTSFLKQELEKTGASIIARMEGHVSRLEQLLRDAEKTRSVLDDRIIKLRELSVYAAQQGEVMQSLQAAIADARRLEQQLARATANAGKNMSNTMERVDAQDFAAVLRASIERDKAAIMREEHQSFSTQEALGVPKQTEADAGEETEQVPLLPVMMSDVPEDAIAYQVENPPSRKGTPAQAKERSAKGTAEAKTLLMNGWSVEDVSRETGMGRGAVELVLQMERGQMGRKG